MDGMNEIVQVISTVGFPIAAAGAMFWLVNATIKDNTAVVNSLKESLVSLTASIESLKDIITGFDRRS